MIPKLKNLKNIDLFFCFLFIVKCKIIIIFFFLFVKIREIFFLVKNKKQSVYFFILFFININERFVKIIIFFFFPDFKAEILNKDIEHLNKKIYFIIIKISQIALSQKLITMKLILKLPKKIIYFLRFPFQKFIKSLLCFFLHSKQILQNIKLQMQHVLPVQVKFFFISLLKSIKFLRYFVQFTLLQVFFYIEILFDVLIPKYFHIVENIT